MITMPIKEVTSAMLGDLNETGVAKIVRAWAAFHGHEHTFQGGTEETDAEVTFVSGKYAGLGVQIGNGYAVATWCQYGPNGEFTAFWHADVRPKAPLSVALEEVAKARAKETK